MIIVIKPVCRNFTSVANLLVFEGLNSGGIDYPCCGLVIFCFYSKKLWSRGIEVGYYLADELDLEVKIVMVAKSESPVSIAVKKGNQQLLRLLENSLQQLLKERKIDRLYEEWFPQVEFPHQDL